MFSDEMNYFDEDDKEYYVYIFSNQFELVQSQDDANVVLVFFGMLYLFKILCSSTWIRSILS